MEQKNQKADPERYPWISELKKEFDGLKAQIDKDKDLTKGFIFAAVEKDANGQDAALMLAIGGGSKPITFAAEAILTHPAASKFIAKAFKEMAITKLRDGDGDVNIGVMINDTRELDQEAEDEQSKD
jgi:hypothetical protein